MKSLLCLVGCQSYIEQAGSFKATGNKTINWAGKIVDEYQSVKVCKNCNKTETEKWIVYGE